MVLRWLLGIPSDDDFVATKGVYAKNENEARDRAEKIARKEGISGELTIEEKSDSSGGTYYQAEWSKKSENTSI